MYIKNILYPIVHYLKKKCFVISRADHEVEKEMVTIPQKMLTFVQELFYIGVNSTSFLTFSEILNMIRFETFPMIRFIASSVTPKTDVH